MAKKALDLTGVEERLMNRKGPDLSGVIGGPGEPRDIEVITAEILSLKQTAGESILGIGQRLIEAKEMLPHGAWLPWLEDRVEFSERVAQKYMRLAREWTNPNALSDLGATKALMLLALPEAERDEFIAEYHVVNGEEKTAADMTSRELEQALRERDAARQAAAEARAAAQTVTEARDKLSEDNALLQKLQQTTQEEADSAKQKLEAVRKELAELRAKPVDVAVMAVDQEKIDAARAMAVQEMQARVDKAEAAAAKAEEKRQAAEAALAQANAKLEASAKEEKRGVIAADRDLAQFEVLFGQAQEIANKLHGLLLKVRGREDQSTAKNLERALLALSERVKEAAQ